MEEHALALADGLTSEPGKLAWLVEIMQRLLAPDGCPWDREQTLQTLRPYLIEECYEVLDAIDSGDKDAHTEELGDLMLQIVFQAALANIEMKAVICSIGEKLIRRHPHVFGETNVDSADQVVENWDAIKAREKGEARKSALDGVPRSLPNLHRAHELVRKARKVGFRFESEKEARQKALEELQELDSAVDEADNDAIRHEVGDLLFAISAWAKQLGV
jgi:MazG family protein